MILSRNLSYSSKKLVSILEKEIKEGSLLPFSGEIHSQREKIHSEGTESLEMEEIVDMRWLNDMFWEKFLLWNLLRRNHRKLYFQEDSYYENSLHSG